MKLEVCFFFLHSQEFFCQHVVRAQKLKPRSDGVILCCILLSCLKFGIFWWPWFLHPCNLGHLPFKSHFVDSLQSCHTGLLSVVPWLHQTLFNTCPFPSYTLYPGLETTHCHLADYRAASDLRSNVTSLQTFHLTSLIWIIPPLCMHSSHFLSWLNYI